jgi:carboxyl-terminal processing protease
MNDSPRFTCYAVLVACLAAASPARPLRAQGSAYEQLQAFSSLLNQIRLNYLDSVTVEQLVRGAITGMLAALDPHSHFLTRAENERLTAWREGRLAGTGILLEEEDGVPTVAAVMPSSPAARAGIVPGDRVLTLNDTAAQGRGAQQLQAQLVGERGTRVRLLLARGSRLEPESVAVTLHTELLRPRAVGMARAIEPGLAYVRLDEFLSTSGREVHEALGRVLRGPGPRRIILDLRGNPGGVLQAAVDVATEFLAGGTLAFRTEGRRHELDHEYRTHGNGAYRDAQIVVLIDRGTASAAEALAGSLQDHDRALILGRRSFGKALVQRLFLLQPTGDAVWLTVGRVLTPSGRVIQRPYRGVPAALYYAAAGRTSAPPDTGRTFTTDAGRSMKGEGGIEPDSALPTPAPLPAWWAAAADSNFDDAVADSVAALLPGSAEGRDRWLDDRAAWTERVVTPFLARVRTRLHVAARPDSAVTDRIALTLADRVAEVRWGRDAAEAFRLRNDPDIRAAAAAFASFPTAVVPSRR